MAYAMKALIIGGTGLISRGVVKHLLARGADVTMYNRGERENVLPPNVRQIGGNRDDHPAFERTFATSRYDVVIDMICFSAETAESDVRAFSGHCEHLLFCSSVCAYGVATPSSGLVDESMRQEPISGYGRGKVAAEQVFLRAHADKKLNATVLRPSHTYGPGNFLIDQLEFDAVAWDRIERGLPVLVADGGVALWQSTHRDDCGKAFAYGALNPKTYGQAYNATRDRVFTWRQYYREVASVLGKPALLLSVPAALIIQKDPKRFELLKDITRFHGAYSSAKAKHDIPEYQCSIDFPEGAKETLEDVRRRGTWRDCQNDPVYQGIVDAALAMGFEPEPA
jgi:nucleoside-diphosphate-sugar epimerase